MAVEVHIPGFSGQEDDEKTVIGLGGVEVKFVGGVAYVSEDVAEHLVSAGYSSSATPLSEDDVLDIDAEVVQQIVQTDAGIALCNAILGIVGGKGTPTERLKAVEAAALEYGSIEKPTAPVASEPEGEKDDEAQEGEKEQE